MAENRNAYGVLVRKLEGKKNCLEDLRIDEMILKCFLKEEDGNMRTEYRTVAGSCKAL
jgi:hypothetical protein